LPKLPSPPLMLTITAIFLFCNQQDWSLEATLGVYFLQERMLKVM
jgi:hypothetical protein